MSSSRTAHRLCIAVALLGVLLVSGACGTSAPPPTEAPAVPPFLLARHPEVLVKLELPSSSRPDGASAPESLPVLGPFRLVRTVDRVQTWEAPLPFRSRKLFYGHAPPGLEVRRSAEDLRFSNGPRGARNKDTWDFTQRTLLLRRHDDLGEPRDGDYSLTYDRATEREDALNRATAGLDDPDFVLRSLQLGESTHTGVFLPAPGLAVWDVVVPQDGRLRLDATILPPEADVGQRSDGATLVVELDLAGTVHEVSRHALQTDDMTPVQVDLSAWAGRHALLRLRTEPGSSPILDYVFLVEPSLYTPVAHPQRLLLVFVDTLRRDHLGTYGYDRETTPRLDAWIAGGTVFEDARSVAPWTLPSTQTVLSGHHPERWRSGPRLQERLATAGWATGAFVGNVYLSSNFDMADGWSRHHCVNWPPAEGVIEELETFFARHPDRPAMAMLHLMDMHLPYNEPRAYRGIWAGEAPEGFDPGHATRSKVLASHRKHGEVLERYVVDRYDQNLRYLDDQLGDLLDELGPEVPVVLFADHGEEFWDHDDFEHGHTLYDELLRIPLLVRGPGVPAGRAQAPVSLLDVAPTVLDLAGVPATELTGRSLLPLARGDDTAAAAFAARAQPIGRPLYGRELWGVVADDHKWITQRGEEWLYDHAKDPTEQQDVSAQQASLSSWHALLGQSLDTWAGITWRLDIGSAKATPAAPLTIVLSREGGFHTAWAGADPMRRGAAEVVVGEDGAVRITFAAGVKGRREVYAVPKGDPAELAGLALEFQDGDRPPRRSERTSTQAWEPDGSTHVLHTAKGGGRTVTVTYGVAPEPPEDGVELDAFDSEVEEALKELGYIEE